MATFTFFDEWKRYMGQRVTTPTTAPDIDADSFVMALSNEAPIVATDVSFGTDVAGITEQNGYTATALTISWAETAGGSGIWRMAHTADVSWTASGGSFGPFQYVVIYDDTTTSPADLLVGYWDVGTPTTITTGNTFNVDLDASFSIFTLDG